MQFGPSQGCFFIFIIIFFNNQFLLSGLIVSCGLAFHWILLAACLRSPVFFQPLLSAFRTLAQCGLALHRIDGQFSFSNRRWSSGPLSALLNLHSLATCRCRWPPHQPLSFRPITTIYGLLSASATAMIIVSNFKLKVLEYSTLSLRGGVRIFDTIILCCFIQFKVSWSLLIVSL